MRWRCASVFLLPLQVQQHVMHLPIIGRHTQRPKHCGRCCEALGSVHATDAQLRTHHRLVEDSAELRKDLPQNAERKAAIVGVCPIAHPFLDLFVGIRALNHDLNLRSAHAQCSSVLDRVHSVHCTDAYLKSAPGLGKPLTRLFDRLSAKLLLECLQNAARIPTMIMWLTGTS